MGALMPMPSMPTIPSPVTDTFDSHTARLALLQTSSLSPVITLTEPAIPEIKKGDL
jgi:hypothetical protein